VPAVNAVVSTIQPAADDDDAAAAADDIEEESNENDDDDDAESDDEHDGDKNEEIDPWHGSQYRNGKVVSRCGCKFNLSIEEESCE
jgi:hypothetical protein